MTLAKRLAEHVMKEHPSRAVTALERLGEAETIRLFGTGDAATVAALVMRMSPQFASAVLRGLAPKRAVATLEACPVDVAVRLLRRVDETLQADLLAALSPKRARSVSTLLQFPEGSAGAVMDPDVLALPQEMTAREARQRVRQAAEFARYNVYVVNQEQRLVGVLNLRELLLAAPSSPLSDLMTRDPHRLLATTDSAALIAHPGWKDVYALPVVDAAGVYLGAIRYRTRRAIEERLTARLGQDVDASAAFGQVLAAAGGGMLDALGGASRRTGGTRNGA